MFAYNTMKLTAVILCSLRFNTVRHNIFFLRQDVNNEVLFTTHFSRTLPADIIPLFIDSTQKQVVLSSVFWFFIPW